MPTQNVANRLAATGTTGRGVTKTDRGRVASVTTASGTKANRNLKTGVGFGTKNSGQKYVKPAGGRPPIPGSQALPVTSSPPASSAAPAPTPAAQPYAPYTTRIPSLNPISNVEGISGQPGQPGGTPTLGTGPGQPLQTYRKGGVVRKTGLAYVHKGERVIPANRASQYPAMSRALSRLRPQPRRHDK